MTEEITDLQDPIVDTTDALYEFYVAGVQHHKLHTCIKQVAVGDNLILRPEPSNRFDPNAVRIEFMNKDNEEVMLGYVPSAKGDYASKVSADLMINSLNCIVTEINPEKKTWEQLKVAIFNE